MKSKAIIFLLFVFLGTAGISQSVFDCALTDPLVTQSEIQQSGSTFFQPCILLGNGQNFSFNNQSDHLIEAHDYIRLTNGVHLGKFENSGKMHLRLMPKNGFDVVMINYSSLEQIQRYERFELGIQLNSELQTKIDNFVSGAQTTEKINPYLEWEMKVFAEYTAPGSAQPIVVDGFYNKEFTSWENYSILQGQDYISDAQYQTLGGYTEIADPYPFRIRFAPPKNGVWYCRIKVVVQNELVYESPSFASNAYNTSWVWSGGNGIEYCYKSVVGQDPKLFLTNETAKTYYKQRLRYIMARWGYSTSIAIWELFSEINNLGASAADIGDIYQQGNNWQMYRDWQWEMAEYLGKLPQKLKRLKVEFVNVEAYEKIKVYGVTDRGHFEAARSWIKYQRPLS